MALVALEAQGVAQVLVGPVVLVVLEALVVRAEQAEAEVVALAGLMML